MLLLPTFTSVINDACADLLAGFGTASIQLRDHGHIGTLLVRGVTRSSESQLACMDRKSNDKREKLLSCKDTSVSRSE